MQNKSGVPRLGAVRAQTEHDSDPRRSATLRIGFAAVVWVFLACGGSAPTAQDATRALEPSEAESSSPEVAELHRRDDARASAPAARGSAERGQASSELPWLNPSHVGAAVRAHHDDFQACQALGDLESRREDGAVTLGWLVLPDGSVNDVTVGPSTFRSASINACVLGVAKQVTFPRSAAPTNISWTLEFRGASSHAPLATVH